MALVVIERVVRVHVGRRMEAGAVVTGERGIVDEKWLSLKRDMKIGQAGVIGDIDHYRLRRENKMKGASAQQASTEPEGGRTREGGRVVPRRRRLKVYNIGERRVATREPGVGELRCGRRARARARASDSSYYAYAHDYAVKSV